MFFHKNNFEKLPNPPSSPKNHENFGTRTMAVFSKLSKAFLLPIALLPIAGVFLGVGAAITSNAGAQTGLWYFGNVLNKMGDVAFGNLPILFAISTALAFTKDAGVAAITAVVGFLVMNGIQAALIHQQFVATPNVAAIFEDGQWNYINLAAKNGGDLLGGWQYFYVPGVDANTDLTKLSEMVKATGIRVDQSGFELDAAGKGYYVLLWVKKIPNGLITTNIGVSSLNTGVLAAIFVGAVSAVAYNRFHKTQLPAAISFFSGTKLVPIVTFFFVIPLSFVFILIWPWIGIGLAKFGTLSGQLPVGLDSLIYEIVERSLVPFGLHHVFYAPLWWTNAGGSISETFTQIQKQWLNDPNLVFGQSVIGGKWNLEQWLIEYAQAFPLITKNIPNWDGLASIDRFNVIVDLIAKRSDLWEAQGDQTIMYKVIANLDVINFTMLEHLGMNLGRFQSGKFGFMLLGLPLASLAMWLNVPQKNRSSVMGIYLSAAFTCFLTGITEPIEYTFLFLAPWLFYGVHMPLAALSFMIVGLLQTHISMTVSGGIIDFIVFGLIPFFGSQAMTWLSVFGVLFVVLGMGIIYFITFYFAVKFGKVMVPGRIENETQATKLYTKADYRLKNIGDEKLAETYTIPNKPAEIAKYEKAAKIISFLGGQENIQGVDACASRLRVDVLDPSKVEKEGIIALGGARGILIKGTNVQIVYGGEQEAIKPRMLEIIDQQRQEKSQASLDISKKVEVRTIASETQNSQNHSANDVSNSPTTNNQPSQKSFGEPHDSHSTFNSTVVCPICEENFKLKLQSVPETSSSRHFQLTKMKVPAIKVPTEVENDIETLQIKYADLHAKNQNSMASTSQNFSALTTSEREKLDGSATVQETRQELQKKATALRNVAKANNLRLRQANLRNLTKVEIIKYLSESLKILKKHSSCHE